MARLLIFVPSVSAAEQLARQIQSDLLLYVPVYINPAAGPTSVDDWVAVVAGSPIEHTIEHNPLLELLVNDAPVDQRPTRVISELDFRAWRDPLVYQRQLNHLFDFVSGRAAQKITLLTNYLELGRQLQRQVTPENQASFKRLKADIEAYKTRHPAIAPHHMTKVVFFEDSLKADAPLVSQLRTVIETMGYVTVAFQEVTQAEQWFEQVALWRQVADCIIQDVHAVRRILSTDTPLVLVSTSSLNIDPDMASLTAQISPDELQPFRLLAQEALTQPQAYSKRQPLSLPRSLEEQRNRALILQKVERYWIQGVLRNTLTVEQAQFDLQLAAAPHNLLKHMEYGDVSLFGSSLDILQVFQQVGRELLILGDPGSGKTILLLQLAEKLVAAAQADAIQPIPVILNLSSWLVGQQTLEMWLVAELKDRYQVPPKIAQAWLKHQDLVLLLDGLDEVQYFQRELCVEAINTFRQRYRRIDLVICSRLNDYSQLTARFELQAAVVIQPLTLAQIERYIDAPQWQGLQEALKTDPLLLNLASTPFLLNIMRAIYANGSSSDILTDVSPVLETRRDQLFERYIQQVIRDHSGISYSAADVKQYLGWLAAQMRQRSLSLFQLKALQPDWLDNPVQYERYVRLATGLFAILSSATVIVTRGLGIGLEVGIVNAMAAAVLMAGIVGIVSIWMFRHLRNFIFGVVFGMMFGTSLGFVRAIAHGLAYGPGVWGRLMLQNGLPSGIFFTLIFAFGFWSNGIRVDYRHIQIEERVWTLQRAVKGAILAATIGAIHLTWQRFLGLGITNTAHLLSTLGWALVGFCGLGLTGQPRHIESLERETRMHQRKMRGYVEHALLIVFSLTLGAFCAFGAPQFFSGNYKAALIDALWGSAFLVGGVFLGTLALIQHFALRSVLYRSRHLPYDIGAFLTQMSQYGFLRQVGNSYLFAHRYLLDYFATVHQSVSPQDQER